MTASMSADLQVKFDKILEGKSFLVGDTLSYADLALYNVLTVNLRTRS